MPFISVLTSVYNETLEQIKNAIVSILRQSYVDFEFIIVNDNPKREDSRELIHYYARIDKRIVYLENKDNIGLAMSMNKAAKVANGKVFARMDADDVSENLRFEKLMIVMKTGKYDLVCSEYICIDTESNIIPNEQQKSRFYDSKSIKKQLPYNNSVIHHPTVVFTREIFERVGGYRNFPCAQDYDLWLRMLNAGAQFYMIKEPLLKYRIHDNSISFKSNVKQNITVEYIRKLYIERVKSGNDSFDEDAYQKYISKYIEKEAYYKKQIDKGKKELLYANYLIINNNKIKGLIIKSKVAIFNGFYRKHFVNLIHDKLVLKMFDR